MKLDVATLVALAKEVESQDGIDWSNLQIDEDGAYNLMALGIIDQYMNGWASLSSNDRELTMLAVITKLLVENFTLNIKNNGG